MSRKTVLKSHADSMVQLGILFVYIRRIVATSLLLGNSGYQTNRNNYDLRKKSHFAWDPQAMCAWQNYKLAFTRNKIIPNYIALFQYYFVTTIYTYNVHVKCFWMGNWFSSLRKQLTFCDVTTCLPPKMTSEEWVQKFHTDDKSLTRCKPECWHCKTSAVFSAFRFPNQFRKNTEIIIMYSTFHHIWNYLNPYNKKKMKA